MHNKKILAKGLIFGAVISATSVNSLANDDSEYNLLNINNNLNSLNNDKIKKENIIEKSINELKNERIINSKNTTVISENVVEGSILEISLTDGEFVPDLRGNPDGYETIKVTTTGNKKLVGTDYTNLKNSGIPKIDLSNACSDSIPAGAFIKATHLVEFKFPQGITSIGGGNNNGAFQGCSGFTGELIIPDSVTSIGSYAFYGCSGLTGELIIPDLVTSIESCAFYGCSGLTGELIIPDSVTSIRSYAFDGCSGLTGELIIPDSVTSIESCAFSGCSGFTGNLVIPDSVTIIGSYAFKNCSGFTGELIIPDSVTSIGDNAFQECSGFTGELIIPDNVTSIGDYAFKGCSGFNGNLVIPDSVTSIGSYAFSKCSGFTGNLVIPDSITSIESYAFYGCSGLKGDLVIPDSVTSIGSGAFRDCSGFNGNLVIPDSVTSIKLGAFRDCSGFTGELIIPDSVTSIESYAFKNVGIEKIIVKIDETHTDIDYRRSIIENLPIDKTYIEMSYNFDVTGSWLEATNYIKARPILSTYVGVFENNEGIGISLEVIEASDIKTMTMLKDGENYILEKSENGKYIFNESGDYQIYIETELGTISNISFKNNSPIFEPSLEYKDNNIVILDNGILSNRFSEKIAEEFDNSSDLKFSFSNSNWTIENGALKSETIGDSSTTENEFIVNAEAGDKIQINVKTSSESGFDWGYIYINGVEVYKKSGTSSDFEIIECDLQEGENTIKFKYTKDSLDSNGEDAMFIDYIKVLNHEIITVDCDTLEYRINGGEWQTYTGAFELNYPAGTKVLVEVRAKHDGFVSSILKQEITVELNTKDIEDAIDKAEQSKDPSDINDARDLVNSMPESSKKDEFQDRLDDIFPNLELESKTATANLDLYIKSENMLLLSLDTNNITFEDFSGVEDMESLNAVNLTVNSSLPYKINAYLATEIQNADGTNIMDKDILNIRANGEVDYNTFTDTTTPIVLLDDQPADNNVSHGIDLMLKGNLAHEKDIYKTVIKFEAEQK